MYIMSYYIYIYKGVMLCYVMLIIIGISACHG